MPQHLESGGVDPQVTAALHTVGFAATILWPAVPDNRTRIGPEHPRQHTDGTRSTGPGPWTQARAGGAPARAGRAGQPQGRTVSQSTPATRRPPVAVRQKVLAVPRSMVSDCPGASGALAG